MKKRPPLLMEPNRGLYFLLKKAKHPTKISNQPKILRGFWICRPISANRSHFANTARRQSKTLSSITAAFKWPGPKFVHFWCQQEYFRLDTNNGVRMTVGIKLGGDRRSNWWSNTFRNSPSINREFSQASWCLTVEMTFLLNRPQSNLSIKLFTC